MRVMIADDNVYFCEAVANYLSAEGDIEYVGHVGDGRHVLSMVEKVKPDVLLLDVVMPYVDGMTVLEELKSKVSVDRPRVIIISAFGQERYVGHANRLGADYYLMKPFSMAVLVKRIRQVMTIRSSLDCSLPSRINNDQVREQLIRYFEQMGVPPHYKGYRYLLEAVCLLFRSKLAEWHYKTSLPSCRKPLWYKWYSSGTGYASCSLITWEKGNLEQLNHLFPYEVDAEKGKPTNSSLLLKWPILLL